MVSKPRISLAACLLPVALSAAGTVRAADEAPATRASCASTILAGDDEEGDADFGAAVAVSGQTALVGIPGFSTAFVTPPVNPPYVSGRVAVFTCEASTQTWTRTATIQLPATETNQYITLGVSTALQDDLAAIGATDGLYVYRRQGQNWNQILQISPTNTNGTLPYEKWGSVIALDDHVLAIQVTEVTSNSAPGNLYVDLYQIVTHGDHAAAIRIARLKPPAGDTGRFGASLALKEDTLVVGDPPDTTVYVYKRHGFTFKLDQKLTGTEATPNTGFGSAVAIAKDVILIGAGGEDLVINPGFGIASSGAVYAFRHTSGPHSPWVETQHFSPATTNYSDFGGSLTVNDKGQAAIGTPSAYDFEEQTSYGPTFFYTLQEGQFVLSSASPQYPGLAPATYLGITDEYLITGSVANAGAGGSVSGASITNLTSEPQ